jgi:luciferase family oxidoreductase group 1
MGDRIKLGALDFSRIYDGTKPTDAIWETLELAPQLESYGYSRFWMSEHHAHDVAHSSPELMTAVVAGLTNRMKIGTGGVLLRYYSPLKVACTFRLLNSIFPGRIDLGLARGFVEPDIAQLLGPTTELYEDKVKQLIEFLRGTGKVAPRPSGVAPPDLWMLGAGSESAAIASAHGTCYCFAAFLSRRGDQDVARTFRVYKNEFHPSREHPQPVLAVAVAGICAESESEARRLLSLENIYGVIPTVIGDPTQCRAELHRLADAYELDEIIFLDLSNTLATRIRSYRLIAQAMGVTEEVLQGGSVE